MRITVTVQNQNGSGQLPKRDWGEYLPIMENRASCKDVEDLLQPYLENKLNIEETELLLNHISTCSECGDELEIRYLLMEGLKRLESGETLDLKKELDDRIWHSRQRILFAERLKAVIFLVEGAACFLLLVNLILFLMEH